jgi:hypothetical protein
MNEQGALTLFLPAVTEQMEKLESEPARHPPIDPQGPGHSGFTLNTRQKVDPTVGAQPTQ